MTRRCISNKCNQGVSVNTKNEICEVLILSWMPELEVFLRTHCFVKIIKSRLPGGVYTSSVNVQICCYSVAKSCLTLYDPMNCSTPGLPVLHYLQSWLKLMSIESIMPSTHLIFCHPLILPPSIFPSIFSNCQEAFNTRLPVCWFGSVRNPLVLIDSWIFRN